LGCGGRPFVALQAVRHIWLLWNLLSVTKDTRVSYIKQKLFERAALSFIACDNVRNGDGSSWLLTIIWNGNLVFMDALRES